MGKGKFVERQEKKSEELASLNSQPKSSVYCPPLSDDYI